MIKTIAKQSTCQQLKCFLVQHITKFELEMESELQRAKFRYEWRHPRTVDTEKERVFICSNYEGDLCKVI